jgi:Zn-dependent M28 family amino/carboxypeptidase
LLPLASIALPLSLAAQQPLATAAATITEAEVRRKIFVIADDSMQGRDTPSRGLDLTALFVADQFKRAGLAPGAKDGNWLQHYVIRKARIDAAASQVSFEVNGHRQVVDFTREAFYREGSRPKIPVGGTTVVIGGAVDTSGLVGTDLAGKTALLILDYWKPRPVAVRAVIDFLSARASAVILLTNRDAAEYRWSGAQASVVSTDLVPPDNAATPSAPVIELHDQVINSMLAKLNVRPDRIRASTGIVIESVPSLMVMVTIAQHILDQVTAANTIGVLAGTDSVLKHEYLVFSAHMDHVGIAGRRGTGGCQAVGADSICNGADDDGSGTVGVTELAKAFAVARPKRSVIFMTVSGEEKGLWGSEFFSQHPVVPMRQIVADFNIDMIGRNWQDTIVAIGKEHSDLGATLNRVNAQHPELHMTAIDDRWPEENFYFRSDHFNFARKGVPILFFFNGVHADYHQVSDSPDKLEAEKEARILRLLFYLGEEVANGTDRPKWNPASYKRIVEGAQ